MIDLSFEGVSKRYLVRREADEDATLHPWVRKLKSLRQPREEFWALNDVSFQVERGETLGIIGHNGAGKSTILKLLAGITTPTSGRMVLNGRLSALIEVGSGFHPELTGRENVFLNGAILGMKRSEIAQKLDRIVDFAGVRPFLDVPVKRFSSGMYVRLGFSIAAHLEPDILLLDEVLAVGDAAFQEKCLNRIGELQASGTTIVFISHDLAAVERVCDRALLMRRGQVVMSGIPRSVIAEYQNHPDVSELSATSTADASTLIRTSTLTFHNPLEAPAGCGRTGYPLGLEIEYETASTLEDILFEIVFYTPDRDVVCQLSTGVSDSRIDLEPGRGVLRFNCSELGLLPGLYYTDIGVKNRDSAEELHWQFQATPLHVLPGRPVTRGRFFQPHHWELVPRGASLSRKESTRAASIG